MKINDADFIIPILGPEGINIYKNVESLKWPINYINTMYCTHACADLFQSASPRGQENVRSVSQPQRRNQALHDRKEG